MSDVELLTRIRADGRRRLIVYRKSNGLLFFEEEEFGSDDPDYDPIELWIVVNRSGLYDTVEIAWSDAVEQTRWLQAEALDEEL